MDDRNFQSQSKARNKNLVFSRAPSSASRSREMTIDSSWLHAFKEELPHAFTRKCPFHHPAVFIDGQIKLMQSAPNEPQTWDQFISRQYARHIGRFFESCDTVVLAFDNYEHVPPAKCMTQLQRRRNVPAIPFCEHSELPSMVPEGPMWTACIANRTFKSRVIDLVLLRLPRLVLTDKPGKTLVVDYLQPVEYKFDPALGVRRETIEDLDPMGEADVKFTRFADRYGSLLVDSIDGDSVPIALMHHERCMRAGLCPPKVSIYRMELTIKSEADRKPEGKQEGPKRSAEEMTRGDTDKKKPEKPKPRAYEYVNVLALYEGLRGVIHQSVGRVVLPMHTGHEMAMLISLIALTGTDFSRHLPQMSGKTVYTYLPNIWMTLAIAFDPQTDTLREDQAVDRLVALIYKTKFQKHVKGAGLSLESVLLEIQASGISQRVRDSMPSAKRISCTVRNANWILSYWTCENPPPNPLQAAYGFTLVRGKPQYADV